VGKWKSFQAIRINGLMWLVELFRPVGLVATSARSCSCLPPVPSQPKVPAPTQTVPPSRRQPRTPPSGTSPADSWLEVGRRECAAPIDRVFKPSDRGLETMATLPTRIVVEGALLAQQLDAVGIGRRSQMLGRDCRTWTSLRLRNRHPASVSQGRSGSAGDGGAGDHRSCSRSEPSTTSQDGQSLVCPGVSSLQVAASAREANPVEVKVCRSRPVQAATIRLQPVSTGATKTRLAASHGSNSGLPVSLVLCGHHRTVLHGTT